MQKRTVKADETGIRRVDAEFLTLQLKHHHSVGLVGMRRVGINTFLRNFFANHKFGEHNRQMYIFIDLNNLVEREAFPFWQLTLKRISDAVRDLVTDKKIRKEVTSHFESAIQYQNLQITYDGVRESLRILVEHDIEPVIFFNRFDRVVNMMSDSFVDNIRGLYGAAGHKLSCVFTSYRPLSDFYGKKLPFDQFYIHYLLPETPEDAALHIKEYVKKYSLIFDSKLREEILRLSGGHFQYLRALMDIARENKASADTLYAAAVKDDRILLLSEEIWESLREDEKRLLTGILSGQKPAENDKDSYVYNSGIVSGGKIFSGLLEEFIRHKMTSVKTNGHAIEFTRKENILFNLLKQNLDMVCEREEIIAKVWPESEEIGISDWSIDKLMERLREKIKKQGLSYQVITVRTRGYKLVKV